MHVWIWGGFLDNKLIKLFLNLLWYHLHVTIVDFSITSLVLILGVTQTVIYWLLESGSSCKMAVFFKLFVFLQVFACLIKNMPNISRYPS